MYRASNEVEYIINTSNGDPTSCVIPTYGFCKLDISLFVMVGFISVLAKPGKFFVRRTICLYFGAVIYQILYLSNIHVVLSHSHLNSILALNQAQHFPSPGPVRPYPCLPLLALRCSIPTLSASMNLSTYETASGMFPFSFVPI